jgi:hypothetical protein
MRSHLHYIVVQLRVREAQSQHRLRLFVNLDGPLGCEARALKAEVKPTDACEQGTDLHASLRCKRRRAP